MNSLHSFFFRALETIGMNIFLPFLFSYYINIFRTFIMHLSIYLEFRANYVLTDILEDMYIYTYVLHNWFFVSDHSNLIIGLGIGIPLLLALIAIAIIFIVYWKRNAGKNNPEDNSDNDR